MIWSRVFRERESGARSGLTTQFVVGAAGESDREILTAVDGLYHRVALSRAYFSGFYPVPGTPLEGLPAAPALREHRLYQGDFLFRHYAFTLDDFCFDSEGNLLEDADPKLAWARAHPEFFPIEINQASREQLLRVPGIGPVSAARIVQTRRRDPFRRIEDLKAAGIAQRSVPYLLLAGRGAPRQPRLL